MSDIKFKKCEIVRLKFQVVRYEGEAMNEILSDRFPNDFRLVSDDLTPVRRGLEKPHKGDWLIFDERCRSLLDVTPDDLFRKTYREVSA